VVGLAWGWKGGGDFWGGFGGGGGWAFLWGGELGGGGVGVFAGEKGVRSSALDN